MVKHSASLAFFKSRFGLPTNATAQKISTEWIGRLPVLNLTLETWSSGSDQSQMALAL